MGLRIGSVLVDRVSVRLGRERFVLVRVRTALDGWNFQLNQTHCRLGFRAIKMIQPEPTNSLPRVVVGS